MPMTPDDLEVARYWQEWGKVAVSALTPIAIAGLTYFISNTLNERQSYLRKGEQILSEKQKTYGRIGEDLNVIYIYCADIGDFRHHTPDQIIERKRSADRVFFMYRPYWSNKTQDNYHKFMAAAFAMHVEAGTNARINASTYEKKTAFAADQKPWDPAWDDLFTGKKQPMLEQSYYALVSSFLEDIASFTLNSGKPAPP